MPEFKILCGAGLIVAACLAAPAAQAESRLDAVARKFIDPQAGVFVVAHRGCHNPVPARAMNAAPENSLMALEHCVILGVDMMELDVRRTRDGALVVIHDATVDRTTNGTGRVADLTLVQIKALRLKDNFGGEMSPDLTGETVPTLDEALAAARGRIMLNLDIKEEIYPETTAATVRAGMAPYVVVKRVVSDDVAPIADQPTYSQVPFMPIVGRWPDIPAKSNLAHIVARQASGRHPIAGVEMVYLPPQDFETVRQAARAAHIRLWANELTSVGVISVIGRGGDIDALRTRGKVWGDIIAAGVDTLQTDEPGPLLDYLNEAGIRH